VIADPRSADASKTTVVWSRMPGDTLQLRLRRIGYSGELVLAAGSEERSGTMRSSAMVTALSEVVVAAEAVRADSQPDAAPHQVSKKRLRAAPSAQAIAPPADSAATRAASEAKANSGAHGVPVVAHLVSCPAQ
jgi:hypothetical protein